MTKVVMPKKGRPDAEEKRKEFKIARRKHALIESSINAVENHGLDRCSDKGIEGFKRYVSLAILARNIQMLGNIIQIKKLKREQQREKYNATWHKNKQSEVA